MAGDKTFSEKLHNLYIYQLETGLLFNYNQLVPATFKNIVKIALSCEKYEWATIFIHNYKQYLPEEDRDSLVAYCFANIYFAQRNYKNVLVSLNEITKTDNIFRELDIKVLKIRTFYELQELEQMQAVLDSLKVHLSRQTTISEFHKKRFKNFTNFLYRICHIPVMEKAKWQKLYTELKEINDMDFLHKEWLMNNIMEKAKR